MFTGIVALDGPQTARVREVVANLPPADRYVTGAAYGVDTVAAEAAMDFWPDVEHIVCVPRAYYNHKAAARLGERGARLVTAPVRKSTSASYMARNDLMVSYLAGDVDGALTAFPLTPYEEQRSGTWATLRRARKHNALVQLAPLAPPYIGQFIVEDDRRVASGSS